MLGQRACYLLLHIAFSSCFTAGETANELLQMSELFKKSQLHDGFAQLQVERAAGQDERRVVVEALQDVCCREETDCFHPSQPARLPVCLPNEIQPHTFRKAAVFGLTAY